MSENNRAGNKADEYKGKAKETLGKATGNEQWQAEGKSEKTVSKLKQAGEKAKDAVTSDKPKNP